MREVRRLRQEKGWNQTELAFYAGLAPSVISEIETGKRNPSAGTLHKLAEALDVDVPDLFERTQDLKVQAPLPPEDAWERGANREGGDQERSIALAEKIQQQLDGQLKTLRDRRGIAPSAEGLHKGAKDFYHSWLRAF